MAIAFDAASEANIDGDTTYSWSHTCSGSERLLLVTVGINQDPINVSSVVYNGAALTKLGSNRETDSGYATTLWGLIAPSTGTNTITVNLSTFCTSEAVASSWTGVDQSTATGGYVSSVGNVATVKLTVSASANDVVVDGLTWNYASLPASESANAAQTARGGPALGNYIRTAMSNKAGAATVSMGWAMSTATNWAVSGIPIKPSAGAPSSTITLDRTTVITSNNSGTSVSWTHTTAGANRALLVMVSTTQESAVTSATYNGVAMTLVTSKLEGTVGYRVSIWKLSNPTLGANTVNIIFSTAVKGSFSSVSFNGCDQTTSSLTGTPASASGITTTPTTSISASSGAIVVDVVSYGATAGAAVGTQQTLLWADAGSVSLGRPGGASSYESGSSTVTMSYSLSATTEWALCACYLKPVAASAEAQSGVSLIVMPNMNILGRRPNPRSRWGFMCEEGVINKPAMPPGIIGIPVPHPNRLAWRKMMQVTRFMPLPDDVSAVAAPTIGSGSIGPRISLPPQQLMDDSQWKRQAAAWMSEANQGHLQNIGTITLTANAFTTTVTDDRVGVQSFIGFTPRTANASTEMAGGYMYVSSQGAGTFTITHANAATTDRTFTYSILG